MLREPEAIRLEAPDGEAAIDAAPSMAARVERMLAQCRRQRGVMALVCVRVERIEAGGEAAPAALRRQVCEDLVQRMRSRVRGGDLVIQAAGGEVGVLMPGADGEAALRVAQRFLQVLAGPYRVGEHLAEVRVSVGQAAYPSDGSVGVELVLRARERMGT